VSVLLTGISGGMLVFLIASGLTLIFGVMKVVNFAHGGFFVLGSYFVYELLGGRVRSAPLFVLAAIGAGLIAVAFGVVAERVVFRRLYTLPPVVSLLGTYAVLLVLIGVAEAVWGLRPVTQPKPSGLAGSVVLAGARVPTYDFALVGFGILTVVALEWLTRRSRFGRVVRAVSEDRTMAELLGVRVNVVFAITFAVGIFFAGLGGALAAPTVSLVPDLAETFIIEAFAVVIVGGLGSVVGSLVASLALGLLTSLLVTYAPSYAAFSLYFLMAAVLIVRPQGLFGDRSGLEAL